MMLTRDERRQLARDNARQPAALTIVPRDTWPAHLQDDKRLRVWRSRDYLVQEFAAAAPALVRLSVNRTSRDGERWAADLSWDELQRIKEHCGYHQHDAVEIYPPTIDEVNVANMRHLWVLRDRLGFAWRFAKGQS
jgi:hypothetical protein